MLYHWVTWEAQGTELVWVKQGTQATIHAFKDRLGGEKSDAKGKTKQMEYNNN